MNLEGINDDIRNDIRQNVKEDDQMNLEDINEDIRNDIKRLSSDLTKKKEMVKSNTTAKQIADKLGVKLPKSKKTSD